MWRFRMDNSRFRITCKRVRSRNVLLFFPCSWTSAGQGSGEAVREESFRSSSLASSFSLRSFSTFSRSRILASCCSFLSRAASYSTSTKREAWIKKASSKLTRLRHDEKINTIDGHFSLGWCTDSSMELKVWASLERTITVWSINQSETSVWPPTKISDRDLALEGLNPPRQKDDAFLWQSRDETYESIGFQIKILQDDIALKPRFSRFILISSVTYRFRYRSWVFSCRDSRCNRANIYRVNRPLNSRAPLSKPFH